MSCLSSAAARLSSSAAAHTHRGPFATFSNMPRLAAAFTSSASISTSCSSPDASFHAFSSLCFGTSTTPFPAPPPPPPPPSFSSPSSSSFRRPFFFFFISLLSSSTLLSFFSSFSSSLRKSSSTSIASSSSSPSSSSFMNTASSSSSIAASLPLIPKTLICKRVE